MQTVFTNGKSSGELDKICAELFVSNRECFAEDKYDDDGILVYKSPPLNDVWLPEPERHDQCNLLEEQQDCTA